MSDFYLHLAEQPEWRMQFPMCSACDIDLDHTGDGWLCDSCGTTWTLDAGDGDKGELVEGLTGQVVPNDVAWRVVIRDGTPAEREALITRLGLALPQPTADLLGAQI